MTKNKNRLIGGSRTRRSINPNNDTTKTAGSSATSNILQLNYRHLLEMAQLASFQTKADVVQMTREEYFSKLRSLRNNFITNGIYDIIKNEIFSNSINNGVILTMQNKILEKEAIKLIQSPMVIDTIKDLLPELLHYGSFVITPEYKEGVGLTALLDEYEAGDVIEFLSTDGNPLCFYVNPRSPDYLGNNQRSLHAGTAKLVKPDAMIYLGLNRGTEKLYLGKQVVDSFMEIPKNDRLFNLSEQVKIRVSTSLLWGNIDKLEDLLLLDRVTIHKDIANLLTPTLLGIPLPQSNSLTDMVETVNKMEQLVNGNAIQASDVLQGRVPIEDISKVKIIPISGDKGIPQSLDTARNDNKIEFSQLKDYLEMFLLAIGIPPDLFLGTADGDTTRIYIRYSKLVKHISSVLISFMKKILIGHFSHKYPQFKFEEHHFNITIRTNSNLDTLEFTEAQELHLASARSFVATLQDLSPLIEESDYAINTSMLIEKLDSMLSEVGSPFSGIFVKKSVDTEEPTIVEESGENQTDI